MRLTGLPWTVKKYKTWRNIRQIGFARYRSEFLAQQALMISLTFFSIMFYVGFSTHSNSVRDFLLSVGIAFMAAFVMGVLVFVLGMWAWQRNEKYFTACEASLTEEEKSTLSPYNPVLWTEKQHDEWEDTRKDGRDKFMRRNSIGYAVGAACIALLPTIFSVMSGEVISGTSIVITLIVIVLIIPITWLLVRWQWLKSERYFAETEAKLAQ